MRVLITRPREQAHNLARALASLGAEPVFFPTIQIMPVEDPVLLDQALCNLSTYTWLIFTSANAVNIVRERVVSLGLTFPAGLRIAAVGPKTAKVLVRQGIPLHFVPDEFTAEAILPGLGDLRGKRVLLPLADIAHDTLPRAIEAAGGTAHVLTAYHTLPAHPDPEGITALQAGVDIVTFTSGSTVRNFIDLVQSAGLNPFALPNHPKIACIGPKTAAVAREAGFEVDVVAEVYTDEGLVDALRNQVNKVDR